MTSGIVKILSQVSVFGRFQIMFKRKISGARVQMIIKGACQRCPDPRHSFEIVDTGAHEPLHSAEVFEQRAALRRPEPRDRFEHGFVVAARAALAMPRNRESMRLVANALNDAKRGRIGPGNDQWRIVRGTMHEQTLLPRLAIRTLRDTDERQ